MPGDTAPRDFDDDHDELAALDFSLTEPEGVVSDLDALTEYVAAPEAAHALHDVDAIWPPATDDEDELAMPQFTVTNPPGTVTVTTLIDGRVQQIELSPKVTSMTETDLADEIILIAELAANHARSAQYSQMLEGMRQQGHDDATTRDFLSRDLGLPTPEEASAAEAHAFTTRYAGDHD